MSGIYVLRFFFVCSRGKITRGRSPLPRIGRKTFAGTVPQYVWDAGYQPPKNKHGNR